MKKKHGCLRPGACSLRLHVGMRLSRRWSRGFTVLELLVALALLAIVVTSTMTVFRSMLRSWSRGAVRSERYQQARTALELLTRDLQSGYIGPGIPFVGVSPGSAVFRTDSVGSELFFVARLAEVGTTELVEVGYWLRSDQALMRHIDSDHDWDFTTIEEEDPLVEAVTAFTIRHTDGIEWVDAWDARPGGEQAGRLPRGVEIQLTVEYAAGGQQETFTNSVVLPLGDIH